MKRVQHEILKSLMVSLMHVDFADTVARVNTEEMIALGWRFEADLNTEEFDDLASVRIVFRDLTLLTLTLETAPGETPEQGAFNIRYAEEHARLVPDLCDAAFSHLRRALAADIRADRAKNADTLAPRE